MITYHFEIKSGGTRQFTIDLQRKYTQELDQASHSQWTELEFHQCQNCPLTSATHRHCPPAVDLQEIITGFSDIPARNPIMVRVITPEREFHRECDAQMGLNSVMGLVMASSNCPILSQLRALANFHLPFATPEETIYRTVGAYLVKQYFVMQEGGQPDFQLNGLRSLYESLVVVNIHFARRIRSAAEKHPAINAVIRLDNFSLLVLFSLQDNLTRQKIKFFSGCESPALPTPQ